MKISWHVVVYRNKKAYRFYVLVTHIHNVPGKNQLPKGFGTKSCWMLVVQLFWERAPNFCPVGVKKSAHAHVAMADVYAMSTNLQVSPEAGANPESHLAEIMREAPEKCSFRTGTLRF